MARHYAEYRPPLHHRIVSDALKGKKKFGAALDVGCGTGQSTEVLTRFSHTVIGVDNSEEMLAAAKPNDRIEYRLGHATSLPIASSSVDLVTFAGVLPYVDKSLLVNELLRVCRPSAIVLPYDFRIHLEPLKKSFCIEPDPTESGYDHSMNLCGQRSLETLSMQSKNVSFTASIQQASHLLLSSARRFDQLARRYKTTDPFVCVTAKLAETMPEIELTATIWFAVHQIPSR